MVFLKNKYTENIVFSQITEFFGADTFSSLHVRFPDTESKNTALLFEQFQAKARRWDAGTVGRVFVCIRICLCILNAKSSASKREDGLQDCQLFIIYFWEDNKKQHNVRLSLLVS